jgi:hypothetical protein
VVEFILDDDVNKLSARLARDGPGNYCG